MRWIVCFVLLLLGLGTPPALAEKRVAIVIGNDVYPNLPSVSQLQKAVADARVVRDTLTKLGFEVTYAENVPLARTKELFFAFSGNLAQGDIAFVYYAGHGVALAGANYLLPSDIPAIREPESEAAIREEEERLAEFAISEAFIIQRLRNRGARVSIVVLDACRDNPLRVAETNNPFRSTRPGDLVFGGSRGLALVPSRPEGIVSVYSANFGQRALDRLGPDDDHPNSPFTRVFLKLLTTPGKGLRTAMLETRDEVVRLARSIGVEQRPGIYDEMTGGDLFLAGEAPGVPVVDTAPAPDPLAADYALASAVGTKEAWEAFLARHGTARDNFHVQLAEVWLKKLAVGKLPTEESIEQEQASEPKKTSGNASMANYIGQIAAHLQRHKRYPEGAKRNGVGGTVLISFTISGSGSVTGSKLVRSSGTDELDREVSAMIDRASPFPPIPDEVGRKSLTITVPIRFSLH